jgi:protein-tyrosine phosphatase
LRVVIFGAAERGDIEHVRMPIRDFDPFSLRTNLPATVKRLCEAQRANGGTAYVHCTAGLGRAPGVALAYMWWVGGWDTLPAAYDTLYAQRQCHPQLQSIRAAACDILAGGMCEQVRSRGGR